MTGAGQGKTQAADFWSTNPNWIFMLPARIVISEANGHENIFQNPKHYWHFIYIYVWNFAFEFKREMVSLPTGQMNQIRIYPIWGQNICERASQLRLAGYRAAIFMIMG